MLSEGGERTREGEKERREYRAEGKRLKRKARPARPMRNEEGGRLDEVDAEGPSEESKEERRRKWSAIVRSRLVHATGAKGKRTHRPSRYP